MLPLNHLCIYDWLVWCGALTVYIYRDCGINLSTPTMLSRLQSQVVANILSGSCHRTRGEESEPVVVANS